VAIAQASTTLRASSWIWVAAVAGALTAGAGVALNPLVAGVVSVICALALCALFAPRLPGAFLAGLWCLLLVYAVLGKGGAYLSVAGVYVGELILAFGLLAAAFGGISSSVLRSPLAWGVIAFGVCGALQTIPYLPTYGVNALRDAVVWGYGVFALLVAGFLVRTGTLRQAPERYAKWFVWWYPYTVTAAWAISRYAESSLPWAPGSEVPILYFKSGDAVFHLAGVAAFVLLDLHHRPGRRQARWATGGWAWWTAWLVATAIVLASSRATFLALAVAGAAVLVLRPTRRLWRPALLTMLLATLFFSSDVEIEVRDGRLLSPREMLANVQSVVGGDAPGNRDATRQWRLQWWRDIIGYTVYGEYFWTGKGFGLNIAKDDGYANDDQLYPLRSPHNGHLTVLARSGVPGMALWLLLQAALAAALVRGYRRWRQVDNRWARVHLWILAYWAAFIVNSAFEVSIEGPHGGIWFWSLFGLGIATVGARLPGAGAGAATFGDAPRLDSAQRARSGYRSHLPAAVRLRAPS